MVLLVIQLEMGKDDAPLEGLCAMVLFAYFFRLRSNTIAHVLLEHITVTAAGDSPQNETYHPPITAVVTIERQLARGPMWKTTLPDQTRIQIRLAGGGFFHAAGYSGRGQKGMNTALMYLLSELGVSPPANCY